MILAHLFLPTQLRENEVVTMKLIHMILYFNQQTFQVPSYLLRSKILLLEGLGFIIHPKSHG